jgi:hypothetical protein
MRRLATTPLFGLLLVAHAAHVAEEAWGGFWLIDAVLGMRWFLVFNALGWIVALTLFLGVRRGMRGAYVLAIAYSLFMALQGVGHNLTWLVTGRYFGGFAGGISGLALLGVGIPLALALRRELPERAPRPL